jgi:hypothetical protein
MYASFFFLFFFGFSGTHLNLLYRQIPVKAGHEFTISTDPKYSEVCDDGVMWVDYVGVLIDLCVVTGLERPFFLLAKFAQSDCAGETHLR